MNNSDFCVLRDSTAEKPNLQIEASRNTLLCIYIYSLFDKQAHLNPSHFLVAEFLLCLNMLFL